MPRLFLLFCSLTLAASAARAAEDDRTLRIIDFEERRMGNSEELPMYWTKVAAPGIPHYLSGRLDTSSAFAGKYSFRFDLNGGSLIYRYDPARIKVQARSQYRVETMVATTPFTHARARLTAYFLDQDKKVIATSMRHSELYAAKADNEGWKKLEVELSADPKAELLGVELELLQPALYRDSTLGDLALYPQDIRGSAWFDDVNIAQIPRVRMSTQRPGNIFRRGDALGVNVSVSDRSTDDLAAQLIVTDARGQTMYQRTGALDMAGAESPGEGQKRLKLDLPELAPGWYQAGLVLTSKGRYVGRHTLDFVLLADSGAIARPDDRFGIIATDLPSEGWAELPDILPYLGAGRIKLAVWSRNADAQQSDPQAFDHLLVRLREESITPTACLLDLPPAVARKVKGTAWTDLLNAPDDSWQPRLATMIARHANHLDRWQLGGDGSEDFVARKEMRQVYDRIYAEFAKLIQSPDLAMPWPGWYELEGKLPATIALSVHPSILPHQLPLYMQDITRKQGHNLSISLQLLDATRYGRELQIRDLAQRVIYALSADAKRIDLPLPLSVSVEDGHIIKQPQELVMVMRTLVGTLGGAEYKGKVPIADSVEAFLFEKNEQSILALWDRGSAGGVRQLAINLGSRPRAIDIRGNVTPLLPSTTSRQSQSVQLSVGQMPFFLVDIDGPLAQLRASVAVDRPLLESSFKPHSRKIRFSNSYKTTIAGTLKLKPPAGWTINPPTIPFSANPGETFERDITIEFPYNSFAGQKSLMAEFVFQGDSAASIVVPITLNLGLSDVGMQTLAMRDGNDLVVQQLITNYGNKPIDYTAFAFFPNQARQERIVANLAPGRSTIKLYRFHNAQFTPTTKARVGLRELNGSRILNDEVEVQ